MWLGHRVFGGSQHSTRNAGEWYNSHEVANAQEVLFGHDDTQGIVAVEATDERIRVYRRVDGSVVTEDAPFPRWILTTERHQLGDARWTELAGDGFRFLAQFPDRESYHNARMWLRDAHALHICLPTASRQYLTASGRTLFKGMAFDDVHRLQLDIETASLRPDHPDSEIILVAISDNRGFETIIEGDEPHILRQTVACLRERDPDIIEGHNIFGFDLPYMAARAKSHGVRLGFGRDGSEILFGSQQNCAIGYFSRPYQPAHIHGRQVIDTLFAVQRWDVGKAALSSHGLKAVAVALNIAEDDREIIAHDKILSEWKTNPERVRTYALQDVRETRALAALVCPAEFYLSQMVPDTYARAATSGTGEKINSIFIRHYLHHGKAIPKQSEPKPLPGGYTEVRTTGLIRRIVKCDVESLYPSLMLTNHIKPDGDSLDVFLPALEELTRRRIEAKKRAKETTGQESAYWDGLQASFKILINSFYGYLAGPFNFNDHAAAARVTTTGQQVVKRIVDELEKSGSLVVEIDTDGVYFQPPEQIDSEDKELDYIERIGSALPEGIRLAHDGRYQAMISLKMKNYVLLSYEGKKTFKGSSLRSRADEPFGLDFISKSIDHLIHGEPQRAQELYREIARKIESAELPIQKFARRERVTEKTFSSAGKRRLAKAAGGAKIGDYITVYQRADGELGLAADYADDEDREYLLDKLYKFACRLREGFGDDFDIMFPRPTARSRCEAAGQQTLGLFD